MRALHECQAEVFRRGHEKIRKRKRKIRLCRNWTVGIVLSCVPLIAGLALLPNDHSEERMYSMGSVMEMEQADAGNGFSVTSVEVRGPEGKCTITNADDIGRLMYLMPDGIAFSGLADEDGLGGAEQEPEAAPEADKNIAETMDAEEDGEQYLYRETECGYTLKLLMADGTVRSYLVADGIVTDLQTGEKTVLLENRAEELTLFLDGKVGTE